MRFKSLSKTLCFFACLLSLSAHRQIEAKPKKLTADMVIIGGGTAGCALANRLSEKYSVILLEAGADLTGNPNISVPSNSGTLITQHVNEFFWEYGHWNTTTPGTTIPKFIPAPAGKLLGGGSSVNGMQWVRSTANYFDRWQQHVGDAAWGSTNAVNVFKTIENFNGIAGQFNPAIHGFSGPVNVRECAKNTAAATLFANAVPLAVTGTSLITDYNDPATPVGSFVNWQLTEHPDETRTNSFGAYLQGRLKPKSGGVYTSKNIVLYTKARAEQILFSNEHHDPVAKGVKVVIEGEEFIIQAKHRVILSAGFQSPVLLQLSGIGDSAILEPLGISMVYHNPNVGRNIVNHPIIRLTATGAVPGDPNPDLNNLYTGGAFTVDTTQPSTDRAFEWIGGTTGPAGAPTGFGISTLLLNAKSKGQIALLTSDPLHMFRFAFNYFSDPADIDSAVALYGQMYATLAAMGLNPAVPAPGSPAQPLPTNTAAVRTFILTNYTQAFHWTGSCSMGTSADSAVVDASGNVFGVKNLLVADVCIAPFNCLGNTQGIAYLIGNVIASKLLDE